MRSRRCTNIATRWASSLSRLTSGAWDKKTGKAEAYNPR